MTIKPAYEQLTKEACLSRLRHGLPLTIEQQRWMATQIWGPIGPRKRCCPFCDGDGEKFYYSKGQVDACDHCNGEGYVCAKCNGTQGTRTNPCLCACYEHSGY
jgi:hypothetical protein